MPRKPIPAAGEFGGADGRPGHIASISIQGMRFGEGDHYACEPIAEGGVRLTEWADDLDDWPVGQRWALEHYFLPLAPDPQLGGAINTRQRRVIYAEPGAMLRLRTTAPTDEFRDWSDFVPPPKTATRHGIWLPDALWKKHRAAIGRSTPGWRDRRWTDHLPADEVGARGRLKQQRPLGRYSKSQHTITYICRDTDRAVGWAAAIHEDALERTTSAPATETREVPNGTAQPGEAVWAFTSPVGDPNNADWPLGDYRIQYDITVLDSGVSVGRTAWLRVSADGSTVLETLPANDNDVTVTGLTIRSSNADPAAGATGDRYGVSVLCANSNSHGGNLTITLELNTADSFADGPWVELTNYEMDAQPGSYSLTGLDAGFDLAVEASPGSYALTGALAEFEIGLDASPGAYSLTGIDVGFDLAIEAVPGSYTLSGALAEFEIAIDASPGAYVLTGFEAGTVWSGDSTYEMDAVPGVYSLTGAPAEFGLEIEAAPGSYALTGATAAFDIALEAIPGGYILAGADAALEHGYEMSADPGAYSVAGVLAGFDLAIEAVPGVYVVVGADAGLEWSAEPAPAPTPSPSEVATGPVLVRRFKRGYYQTLEWLQSTFGPERAAEIAELEVVEPEDEDDLTDWISLL